MAELITSDGNTTHVEPLNTKKFTGDELRELINCQYFEAIRLFDGRLMWFDEAGKDDGLPRNVTATYLLHLSGSLPDDYVAGDALVTTYDEVE